MSPKPHWSEMAHDLTAAVSSGGDDPVILLVEDNRASRPELKQVLKQKGYRVIDTDNGQDAVLEARQRHPDLLVVNMDVPLLYELVAARQIIKHAQIEATPAVIVTHEDAIDPAPMMELGASRNEYVTRLSGYEDLQYLLDYLLPVLPQANDAGRESDSSYRRVETIRSPLLAVSAPKLHPRRDVALGNARSAAG